MIPHMAQLLGCEETKSKDKLIQKDDESFAWAFKLAEDARQRMADKAEVEASTPQNIFLPGLDALMRAMPNHIARSSLFAPVCKGRKAVLTDSVLVSRSDAIITFSGRQLDEAQADVWMQAMYEASKVPVGQPVVINRASFLRDLGRSTGINDYQWLHRTMKDLSFAMLYIEIRKSSGVAKYPVGRSKTIHLIKDFAFDEETGKYVLSVDSRWRCMYDNNEFALIDWEKRKTIGRGQDMAKSLQRLVATSKDSVQRYELEWLKSKLIYSSPLRKFRRSLKSALSELARVKVIDQGHIAISTRGKEQVVLTKPQRNRKTL